MPEESRWSPAGWTELKGYPWDVAPKEKVRMRKDLVSGADAAKLALPAGPISVVPPQQRRMYVTPADVERFGPTHLCPLCTCIARRRRWQAQSGEDAATTKKKRAKYEASEKEDVDVKMDPFAGRSARQ